MVNISIINYTLQLQFLQVLTCSYKALWPDPIKGSCTLLCSGSCCSISTTCQSANYFFRAVNSNSSPKKTLSLARIRTHDLCGTSLMCYQLSCPDWIVRIFFLNAISKMFVDKFNQCYQPNLTNISYYT